LTTDIFLIILVVFVIEMLRVFRLPFDSYNSEAVFWVLLSISMIMLSIIFSLFQYYIDSSLFKGIKLIIFSLLIIIATVKVNVFLWEAR